MGVDLAGVTIVSGDLFWIFFYIGTYVVSRTYSSFSLFNLLLVLVLGLGRLYGEGMGGCKKRDYTTGIH